MFHWLFYLKHFCLFLGINCGIRLKLPSTFPVIAGNKEKITCHLFEAPLPAESDRAEFKFITTVWF